jgi:hypothetical protein
MPHTPGPWYLRNSDHGTIISRLKQGEKIPECKSKNPHGIQDFLIDFDILGVSETMWAKFEDLILMAAAPEMLAALKKWDQFMGDNYERKDISWWDETTEAIRKAEGR